MSAALAADLSALLGPDAVRWGEAVALLDPGWHPRNFGAGIVVSPANTQAVSRLLAFCDERGIGVVPQGGRTGLVGGGVSQPGEIILGLGRLNRIETRSTNGEHAVAGE